MCLRQTGTNTVLFGRVVVERRCLYGAASTSTRKAVSGPAAKGFVGGVRAQIDRPAPGFNSSAVKWSAEWALVWTLWTLWTGGLRGGYGMSRMGRLRASWLIVRDGRRVSEGRAGPAKGQRRAREGQWAVLIKRPNRWLPRSLGAPLDPRGGGRRSFELVRVLFQGLPLLAGAKVACPPLRLLACLLARVVGTGRTACAHRADGGRRGRQG